MHLSHIELLIMIISIAFCAAFPMFLYREDGFSRRILHCIRLLIYAVVSGLAAAWIPHIVFRFPPAGNITAQEGSASAILLYAALFFIITVSTMLLEGYRHLFMQIAVLICGTVLFALGLMLTPRPAYASSSMNLMHNSAGVMIVIPFGALLVFLFIFAFRLRKEQMTFSLFQRVLVLISCLAFFANVQYMIILAVWFRIGQTAIDRIPVYIMISVLFLLGVFIPLSLLIWQLGITNTENKKLSMQVQANELDKEVFNHLTSVNQTLREIKHDTQKHLDVIRSFAREDDISGLLEYIDTYDDSLKSLKNLVSTGNIVVDNIVSDRLRKAEAAGVPVTHKLFVPQTFVMDPVDLTAVLANLLDNAIEACIRAKAADETVSPQILFSIRPYHGMILIHCENTFDGVIHKTKQDTFLSVKTEPGHGHGLSRIQMIVDSVDGFMSIVPESARKKFTVHILIPKADDPTEVDEHVEYSDH